MEKHPIVFISYSHDSETHKRWVLGLASSLRQDGVNIILDQWDLRPGDDIASFMENGVKNSNRVLVICSSQYVNKANSGEGGVAYEKMILNADLIADTGTRKFIPIIRNSTVDKPLPTFLGARLYIDFEDDTKYEKNYNFLLKEIYTRELTLKPPLGSNPFAKEPPFTESNKIIVQGKSNTQSESRGFDKYWIRKQFDQAFPRLEEMDLTAFMEVAFALNDEKQNFNQKVLQEAVRNSQIHTFGWPIGIVIQNRPEYSPRPLSNGVFAELAIEGEQRTSYDYWTSHTNGDFYLLKSLFEDLRQPNGIFFNTRIVRNAEVLLFCSKFYSTLGIDHATQISIRIRYWGLSGREIGSSNPSRLLRTNRQTSENEVESNIVCSLGDIEPKIVELTKTISSPLFLVFDFWEVPDKVYQDIIEDFMNGKVT